MKETAHLYALTIEDCRQVLALLTERVEDHLGVSREEVTEEDAVIADGVLYALREAARRAGIEL